jgi:hypothetical protein
MSLPRFFVNIVMRLQTNIHLTDTLRKKMSVMLTIRAWSSKRSAALARLEAKVFDSTVS